MPEPTPKKSKDLSATIDCTLIVIEVSGQSFGFDTATKISVEPQIDSVEAKKLVIKGILRAQKPAVDTITGHILTLTDNVFNPQLVEAIQGGVVEYDMSSPPKVKKYTPPLAGSVNKPKEFTTYAYSARYDASGQVVNYEKITYPHCQGSPIAFSSEDGVFRVPEYKIFSAPKDGEAPYTIEYVEALPELTANE